MSHPSNEFPVSEASPYITRVLDALDTTNVIAGMPYTNITLDGDGVTGDYDPNVKLIEDMTTMYFPTPEPQTGKRLLTVSRDLELPRGFDIQRKREQTLSLNVGQAALNRIHPEVIRAREEYDNMMTRENASGILATIALCEQMNIPLAVVRYYTITESDHLPIGEHLASLTHPISIHPKPALRYLQRSIKAMIKEETL